MNEAERGGEIMEVIQDETVEEVMEECINQLKTDDPTEATKPVMLSLKDQLAVERNRMMKKIMLRRIKAGMQRPTNMVRPGNKDFGCPYTGKDKFSGQRRKFEDRIEYAEEGNVHRLYYADNNKYNGDGSLKD